MPLPKYFPIEGNPHFMRETQSHGIVNTNIHDLEMAKVRKANALSLQNKVSDLDHRMSNVEVLLKEILQRLPINS